MTQQKVELEGRLGGRGVEETSRIVKEDDRENVAVIPVSGREVDTTRLTISVNTSPREVDSGEPLKRKGLLSRRGSPPAGPASLPVPLSSSSSAVNNSKSGKGVYTDVNGAQKQVGEGGIYGRHRSPKASR